MSEEHASRLRRVVLLILCVLIAGGVGVGVTFMAVDILSKRPATVINAAFDANTITYRDGRLQLYFDISKQEDCGGGTSRWLWTWVVYRGQRIQLKMPLPYDPTDTTDLGNDKYLLSMQVPEGVWDGTWYYQEKSVSRCGGVLSWLRDDVSKIPPIPIEIRGTQERTPPGVKAPTAPSDKNVPEWRKAIISNGRPL